MKSGFVGGVIGSLIGVLLGAAAYRASTPVDARFTYQGQIRDGDALVSGNVDIRFTLWDASDGGSMVGSSVTKTSLPVTDGRFATELDFGASAFSGDARWIQMEVRSPSGSGQYLALPRQRVNAVPYALYSLNGGLSPWNLDVATRDIGYLNGRVGIGTNSPSAALEVVSAQTGNDSVKLPASSVGLDEIDSAAMVQAFGIDLVATAPYNPNGTGYSETATRQFVCAANSNVVINFVGSAGNQNSVPSFRIWIDDIDLGAVPGVTGSYLVDKVFACTVVRQVGPGAHVVRVDAGGFGPSPSARAQASVIAVPIHK